MIEEFDKLDPVEELLRELADTERADVFRKTPVDARALLRSTRELTPTSRGVRAVQWVSIAAVLALAFTIGVAFVSNTGSTRLTSIPKRMIATASAGCDGMFFGCLTGPKVTPPNACRGYDYDADGDIDLVDARTYQLNCNGITR